MTSEVEQVSHSNNGETGLVKAAQIVTYDNSPDSGNKAFLEHLIASKNLPSHIKNAEVAFTIQQMGRELGFATMQAFHYIIPIQGKLSLSAKAVGAVLRKGKIAFQTVEDCVKIYTNGTTSPSNEEDKPVDTRTTIKFYRDGLEEITSFTWKEAQMQGLTTKDNWIRMPHAMMYARCLSKGANRVGQDLLLGLYMTEELYDSIGTKETKVVYDDEGHIKEIVE